MALAECCGKDGGSGWSGVYFVGAFYSFNSPIELLALQTVTLGA